ncbi:ribosome maturation factor RimM [Bermanella sp. R86510]|uniref:ribosome maturation factor RimM n=1 Tax=unclassified Bermanella TaxID=2627862 RepID=UPI0037C5C3D3
MTRIPENFTVIGKISGVHGIKGWVKVYSYTEPKENVFSYGEWFLVKEGQVKPAKVREWRTQGKGLVAALDQCNDRNQAHEQYAQWDIVISKDVLPALGEGEFYYHQLENLLVVTTDDTVLGRVDYLFNTGNNDVMIVKAVKESIDGRERWLPYTKDCVQQVDLEQGVIRVDWDPEF